MPSKPQQYRPPGSPTPAQRRAAQQRAYDDRRLSSPKRGYDANWRKVRLAYIYEHPLCELCLKEGRGPVPVEHVHHVKPIAGPNDRGRLDKTNLQSLCHSCHSRITAKHDGGFGNRKQASQ